MAQGDSACDDGRDGVFKAGRGGGGWEQAVAAEEEGKVSSGRRKQEEVAALQDKLCKSALFLN
jgi:hypothetical protein